LLPDPFDAAYVALGLGLVAFTYVASADKDDCLGTVGLVVPAIGPSSELQAIRLSGNYQLGFSSWDYIVRYQITSLAISRGR
jgi:hypothetical protein